MAGESIDVSTNEDDTGSGGEGPPRRTPRLARKGLGARILLTHAADDILCCVL